MSTLLDILILASILVLAVLAVRSLKKSGRRCNCAYSSTRTSVSTPSVALDTTQRRKNISSASTIPRAMAAAPSAYRPRRSDSAMGPSTTARVMSGTTIVAAIPRPAKTAIATKRNAYGRRYERKRHNDTHDPVRGAPFRRTGTGRSVTRSGSAGKNNLGRSGRRAPSCAEDNLDSQSI